MIDLVERIVDLERVLEHSLNFSAKDPALVAGHLVQVLPSVQHLPAARRQESKDEVSKGCLAATALASHSRERGRLIGNCEREVIQRNDLTLAFEKASPATEHFPHVSYFEECCHPSLPNINGTRPSAQ